MERVRLRIAGVDFGPRQIVARDGAGAQDQVTQRRGDVVTGPDGVETSWREAEGLEKVNRNGRETAAGSGRQRARAESRQGGGEEY